MVLKNKIFRDHSDQEFSDLCIEIFNFQYKNNTVYKLYCDALKKTPSTISSAVDIPFIPIEFFKNHTVLSTDSSIEATFSSSGTTGSVPSLHHVSDLSIYEQSFMDGFERFYGPVDDFVVLALLPSYLERSGSSLIYMVQHMIKQSKHEESGFYLHNHEELISRVASCKKANKKILLIGVSFALLDIAEQHSPDFSGIICMETGGMKGKRKEVIREELHRVLKKGLNLDSIHSEYGMTELLSQAYSMGNQRFNCPPWMKIVCRDTNDPLSLVKTGKTGGINVIDLANLNSCSFIATQDLGRRYEDGSFEVLGRFDNSDIRGCNLMVLE